MAPNPKIDHCWRVAFILCLFLTAATVVNASVDDIFFKMNTGTTANPTPVTISPPGNYAYSAVAPVSGTTWNQLDRNTLILANTPQNALTLYSANNQAPGGAIVDAADNALSGVNMTIYYTSPATGTGTRTEPATGTGGENTIQSGGVMQYSFRAYYGGGNGFIFTFSNLPASTPFALYIYGGTGTTAGGSGVSCSIMPPYAFGADTTNLAMVDGLTNSAGAYSSIWTGSSPNYTPLAISNTWGILYGQTDSKGTFSFIYNGGNFSGSLSSYLNGFQLLRVPISTFTVTGGGSDCTSVTVGLSGSETGVSYKLYDNGIPVAGSAQNGTDSALSWTATSSGTYTVIGTVSDGISSGLSSTMSGSESVTINSPTSVSAASPANQDATVGVTVNISVTAGGTAPLVYAWQKNGVPLTNGVQATGSTISGATSANLQISDVQLGDSASAGSGYTCTVSGGCGSPVTSAEAILSVTTSDTPPVISGLTNQTAIAGNNVTLSATILGYPTPGLQWFFSTDGGATSNAITGQTSSSLTLTNVQTSQNDYIYSLVATNDAGTNAASMMLILTEAPFISVQPTNQVVVNGNSATFSITAGGVPPPSYQWFFNSNVIAGATSSSYTIASTAPNNDGSYYVIVSNNVNSVTSSVVSLTVNSAMSVVSLSPSNGVVNICYDTPLYVTFSSAPTLRAAGKIRIYNVTNPGTPVDTIDLSQCVTNAATYAVNVQPYTIGGQTFTNFPVIINGNKAAIYPHQDLLTSNQTYYVTVDDGTFVDSAGAYFAGISATNLWKFTTKIAGPANRTNLVVAADGSGDFVTVQGAVDSIPANNSTPTIIDIHNGTYTGMVNINSKNNIDFRGQTRNGAVIGYPNNNNVFGGAPQRAAFIINGNYCSLETLTLTNMTPDGGGQAEAADVEGTYAIFENMELDSYQDTFLVHSAGKLVYFGDCLIQGQTDFNWGYGTVYYTNCEVRCVLSGGHVTQPRSPYTTNGFGFINCRITQGYSGSSTFDLGRTISTPTSPSEVLFAKCLMASVVTGYNSDAGTNMSDYSCSNLTATATVTLANSMHLAANNPFVIAIQSAPTWLYDWQPQLAPNFTNQPANQSASAGQPVTFTAGATGIPGPGYQWLFNGNPINGATNGSYNIPGAARANGGNYSVVVTNSSGSVTSSVATLTYIDTPPVTQNFSTGALLGIPEVTQIIGGTHAPTDVEGDTLTVTSVSGATNGTVTTDGTNVTYTAGSGTTDSFTYTVSDGFGGTANGTVTVFISSNVVGYNQLSTPVMSGGTNVISFLGNPSYYYAVDVATNLAPPVNWMPLATNYAGTNGVLVFTNISTQPQDFYRARLVP